jgi:hypothetical protein
MRDKFRISKQVAAVAADQVAEAERENLNRRERHFLHVSENLTEQCEVQSTKYSVLNTTYDLFCITEYIF